MATVATMHEADGNPTWFFQELGVMDVAKDSQPSDGIRQFDLNGMLRAHQCTRCTLEDT